MSLSPTEQILIIEKELSAYNHIVTAAKQTILDNEITKYPIFVATKDDVELGVKVIDNMKTSANWNINASSLEELVAKNIITMNKVDAFRETYKDVDVYNCYFILSSLGHQFAYLPA